MRDKAVILYSFFCLVLSGCLGAQSPAPALNYGSRGGAGSAGMHTVSSGETLWLIAQRYKLSVQDIIYVNDLHPPYELVAMQRLKVPPPKTYTARDGDTLYGISRMFNVSSSQIVRANRLREPYAVKPGQVLNLPVVEAPVRQHAQAQPELPKVAARKTGVKSAPAMASAGRVATPRRASSKFLWPVDGPVISSYGSKKGGLHNDGINIKAPKGAPVRAADNGVVVYAGNELKGFGNLVLLRHADKWVTAYAHMERILVKKGQTVKQGESIGVVGSTGSVDSPQLHFETRRGTDAINPVVHLAQRGT